MLMAVKRLAGGLMAEASGVAELQRPASRAKGRGGAMLKTAASPDPQIAAPRDPRLFRYCAFLSYGHRDADTARWLHESLERFRVPQALVGKVTANGPIPARLVPIFRDRHELAASGDLAREIEAALSDSRFLIVLCSPAAAASRWTGAEIDRFKKLRPDGCVLAAIIDGEPFASEMPGREAEECFPPALRHKYDKRGRATKQRAVCERRNRKRNHNYRGSVLLEQQRSTSQHYSPGERAELTEAKRRRIVGTLL